MHAHAFQGISSLPIAQQADCRQAKARREIVMTSGDKILWATVLHRQGWLIKFVLCIGQSMLDAGWLACWFCQVALGSVLVGAVAVVLSMSQFASEIKLPFWYVHSINNSCLLVGKIMLHTHATLENMLGVVLCLSVCLSVCSTIVTLRASLTYRGQACMWSPSQAQQRKNQSHWAKHRTNPN